MSDLARELDISGEQLARRMSGRRPFNVDELAAAAAWLGIPVAALFRAGRPWDHALDVMDLSGRSWG